MTDSVNIRKVESRSDFKAFFEFPWVLYRDDPHWVPPLLSLRREMLDQGKGPSWEYMEGEYFTAWRGERITGTIAAFINHRHNEFQHEHIGWFGAFDVYDDQEAASALLDTATEWVKARGYDAIRGPQTFTTHEECGLLVEGFTRPVLLMPYHYPYYQTLVESAGFMKAQDIYSFHVSREAIIEHARSRLARLTQAIKKRGKITTRPINRKRLKEEFTLFKELYNSSWDNHWGFVPMTPRELDGLVDGLGMLFDADLAFFAEVDGDPAGFILPVPDFNQVLHRAYARPGVPEALTMVKALWHWKVRPAIDWVRIPLMGVKPEYRKTGVNAVLYHAALEAILEKPHIKHCDGGWILETNTDMISIAQNSGSEIYKIHRFYEKTF